MFMPERTGALVCLLLAVSAGAAALRSIDEVAATLRKAAAPPARLEAVRVLRTSLYHGPRAFQALSTAMSNDLNNEVRQAAAIALLDYEGGQTLALVGKFLKDEVGEEVRRSVCAALAAAPAHLNDPGATSVLSARLGEDESAAVRLAAVAGLSARRDPIALGDLKRAAEKDPSKEVRAAAGAAYKQLSIPPKVKAPKPKKPERASYDAVKGKDRCPLGCGWCECSRPPFKTKPRCVPRADCEHAYYNSYQHQGFSCSWNGEQIE